MAGSDISYESVASDGGWIAASERGRDPVPRIISSSHCVDAYLRLGNKDGPWCSRGEAIAGWLSQGAHHQYETLTDPLMSQPLKMLRFDGAMEACPSSSLTIPLPIGSRIDQRGFPATSLHPSAFRNSVWFTQFGSRVAALRN